MFRRKIKKLLKNVVGSFSIALISLVLATIVYGIFYGIAELVNTLVPLP